MSGMVSRVHLHFGQCHLIDGSDLIDEIPVDMIRRRQNRNKLTVVHSLSVYQR